MGHLYSDTADDTSALPVDADALRSPLPAELLEIQRLTQETSKAGEELWAKLLHVQHLLEKLVRDYGLSLDGSVAGLIARLKEMQELRRQMNLTGFEQATERATRAVERMRRHLIKTEAH